MTEKTLFRSPQSRKKLLFSSLFCLVLVGGSLPAEAVPGRILSTTKTPGAAATGAAWDGTHLWVADHRNETLYRVDVKSGRTINKLLSPGHRPGDLAWDGKYLWSASPRERKIYKVDTSTGFVLHRISTHATTPNGLAWERGGLWTVDSATNALRKLDPDDGTTMRKLPAPSENISGLTWDGRYLWAADRIADLIYLVDIQFGDVIFSIPAPGPHVTGLAHDGRRLFAVDYGENMIYAMVSESRKRVSRKRVKTLNMEYRYQIRNQGPAPLQDLDFYLAVPVRELSHHMRTPPRYFSKPTGYVTDEWGQRFAHFQFKNVEAGKPVTVGWRTTVDLYDVRHFVFPHTILPERRIPVKIRKAYLGDATKYSINDPAIKKAVEEAVGEETNLYWRARRIYRYVHQRMYYKLGGGWNAAPYLLEKGSGSCSEYSFLFIAMCRVAGIPARYVGSFVVRYDDASFDQVFHRWVEIYLPGYGWLPVDPSRGDKPTEAERGDAFHRLTPDFLITTRSGGPSRYLGWKYNSNSEWRCKGRCKVTRDRIAEWTPYKAD